MRRHDVDHGRGDRVLVAHVERDVGAGEVPAHDRRALGCEAAGGRSTDPRRRAGDDRDLALHARHRAPVSVSGTRYCPGGPDPSSSPGSAPCRWTSRCSTRSRCHSRGVRTATTSRTRTRSSRRSTVSRRGSARSGPSSTTSSTSTPTARRRTRSTARSRRAPTTMRIGHGVRLLPYPYNHPVRAAEAAAVVDLVSDGRLEFGTGRSSTRAELEGFGADPNLTRAQWEEGLRLVVRAWTEDTFSADGPTWTVPPRRLHPKPLQQPHPPLWVASTSPDSHVLAGELGLGLLSFTIGVSPEDLAERLQAVPRGADACRADREVREPARRRRSRWCTARRPTSRRSPRRPSRSSGTCGPRCGTSAPSRSGRRAGRSVPTTTPRCSRTSTSRCSRSTTCSRPGACIVGGPERCLEIARRYDAADCDLLLCLLNPYKIPHASVMRSIELLGEHVIPALRPDRVTASGRGREHRDDGAHRRELAPWVALRHGPRDTVASSRPRWTAPGGRSSAGDEATAGR